MVQIRIANQPKREAVNEMSLTKQQIEYKNAILWHVDRINQLTATPPRGMAQKSIEQSFCWAVAALEALVYPYLDSVYEEDMQKYCEQRGIKTNNPNLNYDLAFRMKEFALLMALLHRKGLLLEVAAPEEI